MMHITRKKFWQYLLDNRGQAGEDDEDVVDDDVVDDDDTTPPDDDTEVPGDDDTATGDDTAGQSPEPDQVDDDPTPDPTSLLLEKVAALEEKLSSFTTQPQTQQTPPTTEDDDSPRHLVVEYDDPSHAFHKKTLGQIYDVDPREAFRVDPYLAGKIQQEEMMREQAASEQDKALEAQVQKEQQEFADEFARSEFDADYDQAGPESASRSGQDVRQGDELDDRQQQVRDHIDRSVLSDGSGRGVVKSRQQDRQGRITGKCPYRIIQARHQRGCQIQ
jgi:hypothetical protein